MSATLTIDIDCIRKNINEYRVKLGDNTKFCAVVKADCYGLGARQICKRIEDVVDCFASGGDKAYCRTAGCNCKPYKDCEIPAEAFRKDSNTIGRDGTAYVCA